MVTVGKACSRRVRSRELTGIGAGLTYFKSPPPVTQFPPARLPKASISFQNRPPAGCQFFKHMSLWGIHDIQHTTAMIQLTHSFQNQTPGQRINTIPDSNSSAPPRKIRMFWKPYKVGKPEAFFFTSSITCSCFMTRYLQPLNTQK